MTKKPSRSALFKEALKLYSRAKPFRLLPDEAIEELGDSFGSESQPLVVEVDGEVHELSGSAEAQYRQWRQLLHAIYATETGSAEYLD